MALDEPRPEARPRTCPRPPLQNTTTAKRSRKTGSSAARDRGAERATAAAVNSPHFREPRRRSENERRLTPNPNLSARTAQPAPSTRQDPRDPVERRPNPARRSSAPRRPPSKPAVPCVEKEEPEGTPAEARPDPARADRATRAREHTGPGRAPPEPGTPTHPSTRPPSKPVLPCVEQQATRTWRSSTAATPLPRAPEPERLRRDKSGGTERASPETGTPTTRANAPRFREPRTPAPDEHAHQPTAHEPCCATPPTGRRPRRHPPDGRGCSIR